VTRKLALALVSVALVAVGCGGDDEQGDDAKSDPTSVRETEDPEDEPSPDPADQAIADASLLSLDDFPPGWESESDDSDDDSEESQQRIADCVGVEFEVLYGSSAEAESPNFVSSDDVEISNIVKLASDEEAAARAFDIASGPEFGECMAAELTDVIKEAAADEDDIAVGEPSLNEMSFGDYGDGTLAYRLTIPMETQGLSVEVVGDFVVVRVGRAQTTLSVLSFGSPYDVEALGELTRIATDRLARELKPG
jgi:hypothetical protein